jgi:tRNA(Ile)-lysidine synthase
MAATHPPTLLTLTRRLVVEARLWAPGDRLLVAVSGGRDSMALLHVLASLRSKLGHALVAHGVDHGLRAEAGAELDLAEQFAESQGVPFGRTRVDVAPGGNLQARARAARYEALRAAAARADCASIATAHHQSDRAETVLLRLLRGAGPRGLAVLPARAGDLVRPFLHAPRAAIDAHIGRHAIPFALDPSNRDPRFARVRVRAELLPLLRELSPGIEEHLCALADQLGSLPIDLPQHPGPLARASREGIDALVAGQSTRARVRLKGGLVARWDSTSRSLAVDASEGLGAPDNRRNRRNTK